MSWLSWLVSWALFWLGHLVSKIVNIAADLADWNPDDDPIDADNPWWFTLLYDVYNNLMGASYLAQKWAGADDSHNWPWGSPSDK